MKTTISKIDEEQTRIASETRAVTELQESKRCVAIIFSKINEERIRIARKTRAISELQENKICIATTTINKKMKEANSFAKGASESRIVDASQSQKKAVASPKTINQLSESASQSKRQIIVLPERTGELELQHEWRVNIAS